MATIYILEDDLNIQEIEAYALKNSGYQTEGFDNARDFFKKVSERVPSLLLLLSLRLNTNLYLIHILILQCQLKGILMPSRLI